MHGRTLSFILGIGALFGSSLHAEYWRCQGGQFYMTELDQARALTCVREGLAAGSGWQVQPQAIAATMPISVAGVFTARSKDTLNRRLLLYGLPPDNLLSVEEIRARSADLTVDEFFEIIKEDWLKAYCP